MKLIQMAINDALAARWNQPAIAGLVNALGEQPNAVFDFESMTFSQTETRIVVVGYRNQDAWEHGAPLPGLQRIELRLTRAEHLALEADNPDLATLEASVRNAAWSLVRTHPKMVRGATPAEGEEDTRENVFQSGALTEVE